MTVTDYAAIAENLQIPIMCEYFEKCLTYLLEIVVGYAKNKAVKQSSGAYLCYMDAVSHDA